MHWSTFFLFIAGLGGVLYVAMAIWEFIVSVKVSLVATILALFCGLFGIRLLVQHWDVLKRPWIAKCSALLFALSAFVAYVAWEAVETAESYQREAAEAGRISAEQ